MEPRTGKTKVAIDYASMLAQAGRIRKVFVVCPPRVMGVWARQITDNCPHPHEVVVWDAQVRKSRVVAGRRNPVRQRIPEPSPHVTVQFVVVNYEAFAAPGRARGRDATGRVKRSRATGGRFDLRRQIRDWVADEPVLGVLDESHRIKNPAGKAATMVVGTGPLFTYRVLCTGTPVTKAKRAHDVYMQWKWLNPDRFADWPTVEDFKNNTGRWIDRNGFPQWVSAKQSGLQTLRDRVHADAYAITRQEAGLATHGEPDVERVPVTLSPATARAYDEMAEQMVAEIRLAKQKRATIEASIVLVQTLRLAQITAGIAKTDDGRAYRIGRDKLDVLEQYVDEAREHDEKLIVVARFKPDLRAIASMCRDKFRLPTFELHGAISKSTSDRDLIEFERLDGCGVYVVQPQAGSVGVDMGTAPRMIWHSLTSSWVDFTQMNDRNALFPGLRTQTYLLAQSTVDEVMLDALGADTDVGKYVVTRPESLLRAPTVR